ncbi:MAG: ATP-binding cassette domain-containing protein [Hadesarchaea archaeon]|nr:ATP-binding cassette domain-containing protein [Hadesarchaea archaeon]MDH5686109.1 ATP-binding cassette domain-containing protein [Hadesarchaea archaeon]
MTSALVEMKNIHKWFGKVHALMGVDFSVNPSEIVGLVGDNGAGKSTLIKILTGVLSLDEGEIHFNGKKIRFSSPREARNNGIETIYQEQALADDLSVTRNLFMGKELQKSIGPIKLLDHKKMKKESEKILSGLGLSISSMDQETRFCSGGERQGVAIARAMYFKAKLVILDEPTRALGVAGVRRVLELVKELKSRGIASIFITHNLHHVYPIADRFVVLVRGKKVGDSLKKDTSINKLTTLMIKK